MKITSILKLEGTIFFIASIWAYYLIGSSWWLFFVLLLVPDIFMIGYVKNSKLGAVIYNIGHSYITPLILTATYMFIHIPALLPISIIWLAHINMDRMLGFGLKLDKGFKHTHLGEIGSK